MMKSVLKNLTVLNGFLIAAVASSVYLIVVPFLNMDIRVPALRLAQTAAGNPAQKTEQANPAPVDYNLIAEQNLFHPDRKIPPEKTVEKAIPRPEIVLYGVLLSDDVGIAYIEDKKAPRTTPGRGKRQTAVQKGDNVGGYILQQIEPGRITLVKGDDTMVVRLEDGEKRRDKEMTNAQMMVGNLQVSPQSSAPAASSESHKVVTAGPSLLQTPASPKAGDSAVPGTRPRSRQEGLLEVQRLKQERLQSQ